MNLYPHIKSRFDRTQLVMLDVVIALIPVLFAGWLAYGQVLLNQLAAAIIAALVTEFVFSTIFLKKKSSIFDGSAIVTAILLVCTLAPLTPWYIVAFGSSAAILFGKILWGGLGKNRFNPALVGREFITVFFSVAMTSPMLWKSADIIQQKAGNLFPGLDSVYMADYLSGMVYKTNGAMGEASILALIIGGLYLLIRNRISWHIPFSLLFTWSVLCWINGTADLQFSIAGILLGTIFMATDMPSSPTTSNGKIFYGAMIGVCLFVFVKGGVRYEYMSYAILLMNGFSSKISSVFKPTAWGEKFDYKQRIGDIFILTLQILTVSFAVLSLDWHSLVHYVIYIYIVYLIFKFNFSFSKSINKYV